MTFIELTREDGTNMTLNSDHIVSFRKCTLGGTEIFLINNATTVKEKYEDLQSLLDTVMIATIE